MSSRSANTVQRIRSFRGCGTCRSRHVKCDETRPTCFTCAENGWSCDGYSKEIFFENDVRDSDRKARYRQLLFTDHEREVLNEHMLEAVPFSSTSTVLSNIDEECANVTELEAVQILKGPFGVWRISNATAAALDDICIISTEPTADLEGPSLVLTEWDEIVSSESHAMDTRGGVDSFLPILSPLDLEHKFTEAMLWQSTFQHAPLLLKHYADVLIPMLTSIRHQKTPWHVLFLPSTKQTLATITIGQEADGASLTIFFGTLALSASSLGSSREDADWAEVAHLFRCQAQVSLQGTLKYALDLPKRFKYKHIIMAILTMIHVSMSDGLWDETDTLLLEAEKLVRLRGLTKSFKSRKVRILHHCYAYTRILQESVSLTSSRSPNLLNLMDAVESSGVLVKGADTPFFGLNYWDDLEHRYQQNKSQEVGENDLHLASPGRWKATLYPEIFGVPETWLNLLSQTIRLATEKALAESMEVSMLSLREFSGRAKALERCILRCMRKSHNRLTSTADRPLLLRIMQEALYNALVIYFYRRIYEVDADLLQAKALAVKQLLEECRLASASDDVFEALMWPAFVAGCEAIEPELQHFYLSWFESESVYNKVATYKRMRELMQKVWQHRESDDANSCSWLQFLYS